LLLPEELLLRVYEALPLLDEDEELWRVVVWVLVERLVELLLPDDEELL
jgi:hypothetical protein